MKDILGKEIRLGDHVAYIRCFKDKNIQEAIVIECKDKYIEIEYLDQEVLNNPSIKIKKQGYRSRFAITDQKIIVINTKDLNNENVYINIYYKQKEKFNKELKEITSKLYEAEKKNKELQAIVDKINNRFEILDL